MYKVQKRDGGLEDFEDGKIIDGVTSAGGSNEDAQSVLSGIQSWLPGAAKDGVVNAADIRTKVIELLGQVNPEATKNFEAYRKTS